MKEGVGETSGQTAGSNFERSARAFEKPVRQKNRFSSFGADRLKSAVSPGTASPRWDLVLTCSPTPSFPPRAGYDRPPVFPNFIAEASPASCPQQPKVACANGYPFAKIAG
jgi:hypothetical protein